MAPAKTLPVVDFRGRNAGRKMVESMHKTGFIALINVPLLEPDLVAEMVRTWRDGFFTRSDRFKKKWPMNPEAETGWRGRGITSSRSATPDIKEIMMYRLYHPETSLPSVKGIDVTNTYATAAEELGMRVLEAFEMHAPEDVARSLKGLREDVMGSTSTVLRGNYYPADVEAPGVPAAAHRDVSLITVLSGFDEDGLYAIDRNGHRWEVKAQPGLVVINAGEVLSVLTGGTFDLVSSQVKPAGFFPGTLHGVDMRPRTHASGARMSFPLFMHMNGSRVIGRLPKRTLRQLVEGKAPSMPLTHLADEDVRAALGAFKDTTPDIIREVAQAILDNDGKMTSIHLRDRRLMNHSTDKKLEQVR